MQQLLKEKKIVFFVAVVSLLMLFSFKESSHPSFLVHAGLNSGGDTAAFEVNTSQGWGLYSSYMEQMGDSVDFELILFRNTPDSNNWSNDSQIGTVVAGYAPSEEQVINYQQLPRKWQITIKQDGKCFFRLIDGPEPEKLSFVLPVQTKYKK